MFPRNKASTVFQRDVPAVVTIVTIRSATPPEAALKGIPCPAENSAKAWHLVCKLHRIARDDIDTFRVPDKWQQRKGRAPRHGGRVFPFVDEGGG